MILDVLYNLARKSLGTNLYKTLKKSPLGRPNDYYTIDTYKNIFDHYCATGIDFKGKRILEVGSGEQFFTALFFSTAGAKSVTLVDPKFSDSSKNVLFSHCRSYSEHDPVNKDLPQNRENIHYYKSLALIPENSIGQFDVILSHFVLEHFDDLNGYYKSSSRLLADGGLSYNFVDLSDHIYHIFDSHACTKWIYAQMKLYHLRYSDRMFNFITDKRIWVNRYLLPAHKKFAVDNGFEIVDIKPIRYHKKVPIHPDVLIKNGGLVSDEFYTSHFSMLLKKGRSDTIPRTL